MKLRSLFAFLLLPVALYAVGCDNKMDPKECDKIRGEAFDLTNKGQRCNADPDCRLPEWPTCTNPVSTETWDKMKPMMDAFRGGQCEEPQVPCNKAKDYYCKQGLCVFREVGTPENLGGTPASEIIVQ